MICFFLFYFLWFVILGSIFKSEILIGFFFCFTNIAYYCSPINPLILCVSVICMHATLWACEEDTWYPTMCDFVPSSHAVHDGL